MNKYMECVPLPKYVMDQNGGIWLVVGFSPNSSPKDHRYHGVSIHGNVNFNLFPNSVKPIDREKIAAFLNNPTP